MGRIFFIEGKYDSAAYYFNELPDTIDEYLYYIGKNDYYRGLWGSAEEKLMRHREFFPGSVYADRAIYLLGLINFKRREYAQAITLWQELVQLLPNSNYAITAVKGIADAYFELKDYKKALGNYRKVKEYKPPESIDLETKLKIYETLYHLKRYLSLVDALRRFIEENSNSSVELIPKTRLRIAKILFDEKEYYQSLAELNKIIENYALLSITNEALVERSKVCKKIGNMYEMKSSLRQLLLRNDAREYYPYAVNELGMEYLHELKYDSALYYYNILLNYNNYREMALFEIAQIYKRLGQYEEAVTMIDKLISEFPNSIFLLDAYLLKSESFRHRGNYEKANILMKELLEKMGERPEIYLEIGNIYFEIQDYFNARENYLLACEEFKQKRNEAAKALILAGDASIIIGDKKNAKEYYLRANMIAESPTLKDQSVTKLNALGEE